MTPREHLAGLVGHPERVLDVPHEALPGILIELASIQTAIAARVASGAPLTAQDATAGSDKLVDVETASEMLAVSHDFLYSSPVVKALRVKVGARVLFSQKRIQAYIGRHAGRE